MPSISTLSAARSESESRGHWLAYGWAALAGLLIPVLIVLVGLIAQLLNSRGIDASPVRLGTHLHVPLSETFVNQAALIQLSELVVITLLVAAVFCLSVWMHRRAADSRSRRIVKLLHTRALNQSLRRAEVEGAAAQHVRAQHLIGEALPELQQGLSLWYRSIPRSVLMLVGCVALALLVNVWLALLAVVSGVLLRQLNHRLRHDDQTEISNWEVPRSRQRMAEIVGQAPMLARLQTQGLADRSFQAELDALYRRLGDEDSRNGRSWPLLFLASSVAIAVLVLGLGVNLFGVDNGLSVPAAVVLGLSLFGAVTAASRLSLLAGKLRSSGAACDEIYSYLKRSDDIAPTEQRVGLSGLRDGVEIRDVTLNDSKGKPILSHLSLDLTPGSLVALLGTKSVSARALVELLMGFGRPSDGMVLVDGIKLLDVHPQALAKNVMWIEPSGPIWDGTLDENLRGGDDTINNSTLVEALEKVHVYERLQRLPEGLNTYVNAGDSMLDVEATYAIAIARALIHRPPVLLAMEPPPPAEHLPEDPCLMALRELVNAGTLVVMLPRRLQTLRGADRVVLFNGPRLVGEGKHAELLNQSDLYRHLNYLLFNPYRHQRNPRV
ncbi:ABC transporter ATP-binding protein [Stieleria marina]|uniref:Iron import ATP-binding/permease protein IrtB n=1 Tax=Stieleria marina TaxID=1930275 RepID=A0A517NZ48_9BACT|nr:Iron import ATP-binding/permease protein IrtB [Planctomycetes bacterium K23_9]